MDINRLLAKHILKITTPNEDEAINRWAKENWKHDAYLKKIDSRGNFSQNYYRYRNEKYGRRHIIKICLKFAACLIPVILFSIISIKYYINSNISFNPGESKAILFLDNNESFILDPQQKISYININDSVKISNRNGIINFQNDSRIERFKIDNTISVPKGCEYKVVLSDGTKIHLNSLSTLRFPFSFNNDSRCVELHGEAYFEIAKDSQRPFYVKVNGILVRQYGTKFSVYARTKDRVNVALESGSVAIINREHNEHMIKPGEIARWNKDDNKVIISDEDITPYTAWHYNRFVFNDNTLYEIMQALSLWYNVDVTFDNENLKDFRFTGNLGRYDDMNQILNSIESIDNIEFRKEKNHISIGYK